MIKLSKWESKKGVEFLKKAGIKQDQIILDFGCNVGNYTIPAAIIVKEKGIVFAIDEDDHTFGAIDNKAKLLELNNIKTIKTNGELNFDFADIFFDFIMLYDVLHYLNFQQRKILYKENYRILRTDGILSIHPKHMIGNFPLMELRNVSVSELITEIEDYGFKFNRKIVGKLSHNNYLEEGYVINFSKTVNC
jgi:SAM-dependent methyltransferase